MDGPLFNINWSTFHTGVIIRPQRELQILLGQYRIMGATYAIRNRVKLNELSKQNSGDGLGLMIICIRRPTW